MILIVGLGNPGEQFKNTRHNIGREITEAFRAKMDCADFRFEKKWKVEISEGKIDKKKVIIIKPNTFMNKSGQGVTPVVRFFKIKPKDVFIIHDDADIALGKAKLSFGKSSAGHKGVESVLRALQTKDCWRLRIGIGGKRDLPAEKLVLKKFTPEEAKLIRKIIKKTVEALEKTIQESPEKAMNEYHR